MLLACDIGNTAIKFGVFDGSAEAEKASFSLYSSTKRTADEYGLLIRQLLFDADGISVGDIDAAVISSVVPALTDIVSAALRGISHREPFLISTGTHTGFPIRIESHSQLGADIVSNTAEALTVAHGPLVIVDVGTATTVTAVSANSELLGTIIVPGVKISLEALYSSAALLSEVTLEKPDELIGKNSGDSIASGVINGSIIMIDGFIRSLREELCTNGEKLALVGTGGLCQTILPHCRNKFTIVHNLTLKGAARLYYNNKN